MCVAIEPAGRGNMLEAFKGLVSSKKFWMTVVGSAIVGGLSFVHAPQEVITLVATLFGLNVAAQGLVDFGKSKPQIK